MSYFSNRLAASSSQTGYMNGRLVLYMCIRLDVCFFRKDPLIRTGCLEALALVDEVDAEEVQDQAANHVVGECAASVLARNW